MSQEAYIVAGYRTAVTRSKKGGFRFMAPVDMAKEVIDHLMKNVPAVNPAEIDDLIVGNAVNEAEQGLQMARWVAVRSLPLDVPAVTINRYCGSGIEAVAMATAKIRSGMADMIVAGGTESMGLVPIMGYKTVPNYHISKDTPEYMIGMGLTAENISDRYNIGREEADEFAYNSHMKAIAAQKAGKFKDEIVPVDVEEVYYQGGEKKTRSWTVDTDEGPRPETTTEVLGKLRPVFRNKGRVTAGNSSPTNDGAAFVLILSERKVKELNLEPIARMITCASAGVDPAYMGMGPVAAAPKALKQAGLTMADMDLVELNEAFAAQSLAVIREGGFDPSITNVNGGAIALGHPLGCTGTKLTVQLINELRRRNGKYGMVTACIGGGQGIAGVYEFLN